MLNCLAGIRRRRIRGREVWCLKARAHSLLFLWTSFVSVYCLSVSSYQLTCCEISHFHVMAMHLFSWSFLLQRSFSWRWYIGLLIGLLSPPVFSFSWSVVLPHPNSHVSVCLCTPMIHSPQSCFSHCDHTADHHAEFPNCHKNCFFHFFPPFWTTAHTFPWMSSRSNINMKWPPCQKGLNAEGSRPSFVFSPPPPLSLNISHLFLTHLSCAFWVWLNTPLQPAVPLSPCCRVALRSMVTLAQFELLWCQNYCCHGNEYLTYFDSSVCIQFAASLSRSVLNLTSANLLWCHTCVYGRNMRTQMQTLAELVQ